jgi:hypothetical protein
MAVPESVAEEGAGIVIRGQFNPAVFSPLWFLSNGLIGEAEFGSAELGLIAREVCDFRMGWLSCHVDLDGLQLTTANPEEFERLRDATVGVLRLLSHTPIATMGINRSLHLTVASQEQWHRVGHALAPKAAWESVLTSPGMRNVTMWGVRDDDWGGRPQVQVEPSLVVPQAVFVSTNDHFTLVRSAGSTDTAGWDLSEPEVESTPAKIEVAIEILLNLWRSSISLADAAVAMIRRIEHEG